MPDGVKRTIFLASIIALVEGVKSPSVEIVDKLNNVLKLAHDHNSLALPMYANSFIWNNTITCAVGASNLSDCGIRKILNDFLLVKEVEPLVEFFSANAPEWLRYGTVALVKEDLRTVFRELSEHIMLTLRRTA